MNLKTQDHYCACVDDEEEGDHLHGSPQRLYQLAHQDQGEDVHHHLPQVDLEEAVGECCPQPEVRGVEVSWKQNIK